jgi:hypothetical protein
MSVYEGTSSYPIVISDDEPEQNAMNTVANDSAELATKPDADASAGAAH